MDEFRTKKHGGPLALLTICVFVCAALFTGRIAATGSPESLDIRVSDQQVTLNAENVDLRQILEELADKARIGLWISGELQDQKINASFENEPLRIALSRLLQNTSYALVQDSDNYSVAALYVLSSGEEQTVMIDLKPDIVVESEQIMQNFVPNIFVDSEQVIQDALQSDTVPDDIKAALLSQGDANREAHTQELEVQRLKIMTGLIDIFEENGMANPETIRGLRETLAQEPALVGDAMPASRGGN